MSPAAERPTLLSGPGTPSAAAQAALAAVRLVTRRRFEDARGAFMELWRADDPDPALAGFAFVQDNVSTSGQGVLRGLHAQWPTPQAKLLTVLHGRIFDVAVDVRPGSPAFGQWVAVELSAESGSQLMIPPGFAHGFQALEAAVVAYKCSAPYAPAHELAVDPFDPALAIPWPLGSPIVSARDAAAPRLAALPADRLPPFVPTPSAP